MKIAGFLAIVIMFATACEKQGGIANKKVLSKNPVVLKILDFKTNLQSPNKTDLTMPVDSAVWYLEALLNYENCIVTEEKNTHNLTARKADSLKFNVEAVNGEISYSFLINTLETINDRLNNEYQDIDSDVKYIDVVDLEIVNGDLKDGSVELKVMTAFSYEKEVRMPDGLIWLMKEMDEIGPGCPSELSSIKQDATEYLYAKVNPKIHKNPGVFMTNIGPYNFQTYEQDSNGNEYLAVKFHKVVVRWPCLIISL